MAWRGALPISSKASQIENQGRVLRSAVMDGNWSPLGRTDRLRHPLKGEVPELIIVHASCQEIVQHSVHLFSPACRTAVLIQLSKTLQKHIEL